MRAIAFFFSLWLTSTAVSATTTKWIVKADQAYGCKTAEQVAQLHTMSILRSAFEIALAERIDAGDCKELPVGELLTRLADEDEPAQKTYRMRRSNDEILFVDPRFIAEAI